MKTKIEVNQIHVCEFESSRAAWDPLQDLSFGSPSVFCVDKKNNETNKKMRGFPFPNILYTILYYILACNFLFHLHLHARAFNAFIDCQRFQKQKSHFMHIYIYIY